MQKFNLYSVYDEKAATFSKPVCFLHDGQALREIGDAATDPKSVLSIHPSDFKIYRLGSFNDCSGEITSEKQPHFLANVSDFVKPSSGLNAAGERYLEGDPRTKHLGLNPGPVK